MLLCPPGDTSLRLVSIDPGTTTLGIALSDIDLIDHRLHVQQVETWNAAKATANDAWYRQTAYHHGDRYARLVWHRNALVGYLHYHRPHAICIESPFMGIRPHSFAALVECMQMLQEGCREYDPFLYIDTVAPQAAKKALSVAQSTTKKGDVQNALLNALREPETYRVTMQPHIMADRLDEHSVDAVLVGYHFFKERILLNAQV